VCPPHAAQTSEPHTTSACRLSQSPQAQRRRARETDEREREIFCFYYFLSRPELLQKRFFIFGFFFVVLFGVNVRTRRAGAAAASARACCRFDPSPRLPSGGSAWWLQTTSWPAWAALAPVRPEEVERQIAGAVGGHASPRIRRAAHAAMQRLMRPACLLPSRLQHLWSSVRQSRKSLRPWSSRGCGCGVRARASSCYS
jgi:hypothetical protein